MYYGVLSHHGKTSAKAFILRLCKHTDNDGLDRHVLHGHLHPAVKHSHPSQQSHEKQCEMCHKPASRSSTKINATRNDDYQSRQLLAEDTMTYRTLALRRKSNFLLSWMSLKAERARKPVRARN
jgi:hypothetical protein